jgi:HAD superfamily 5'-nucleotidase-like hydrolase
MSTKFPSVEIPAPRKLFCNRTLNLRAIKAIGYDMDYTLIHYHVEKWEETAYEHMRQHFRALGWPVDNLKFDATKVCRGLIVDTENGNLVKANRFGFIKQAFHGTSPLSFEHMRRMYARTIVDLNEKRWVFLNTLFSLSEGCMYAQLTDLLVAKKLPEVLGHYELYTRVRDAMNRAHVEGFLKQEIMSDPDRFIVPDPEVPQALIDQKYAGKKLMLITNSEWNYTKFVMDYTFNRHLPHGMTWRSLFDIVIVAARKPDFFTGNHPLFEVVSDEGMLLPTTQGLQDGKVYYGGSAQYVEKYLGCSGDEILYVGDHMFGDVRVTKEVLRWRTGLIVRELEDEIAALETFSTQEKSLDAMMATKEDLEIRHATVRLNIQRLKTKTAPGEAGDLSAWERQSDELKQELRTLDPKIATLAEQSGKLSNNSWGLLFRTGNDKSMLAFQVERYADIYTSRVSNFLRATPFVYLRSSRGTMPHDRY